MTIRFAATGFAHNHIFNISQALLRAGAELVWYWDDDPERVTLFGERFPEAKLARSVEEILEDETIDLVASAGVPDERGPLGIRVMQHGKDYICTKPGFASLEQLAEVRRVQAETDRKYIVFFGERLGNPATVRAAELVHAGAIGQVVETVGFGPHRLYGPEKNPRPPWTFDKARYGGIINDLASHQIDQFLYFTNRTTAEVKAARTANLRFTEYPDFEDFGEVFLQSGPASGFFRVDWYTPQGLPTWGDVRLFVLGTEGYLEVRKNIDLGGVEGHNRIYLVTDKGIEQFDCAQGALPFGAQFIHDIQSREETALSQAHVFTVSELALQAQKMANGG